MTQTEPSKLPAVFAYGFRPFFLAAGLYALLMVPIWLLLFEGLTSFTPPMAHTWWHAHEMVFGFATASLAGFMLTAVPGWIGAGPVKGWPLVLLFLGWLAGRIGAFLPGDWAPVAFASLDLLFIPMLALTLGPGIWARNRDRNGILVGLLALLFLFNLLIHFDNLGITTGLKLTFLPDALTALHAALITFCVFVSIVGGRVVPAFTIGGMRMAGNPVIPTQNEKLDKASVRSILILLLAQVLGAPAWVTGLAACAAGLLNAWRLAGWQGWKTWRVPLVAILHMAYLWLVAGLMLLGLAHLPLPAFATIPISAALHALSVGAVTSMTLAVMTRATLGHTGRVLHADSWTTAIYLLVTTSAFIRVVAAFPNASIASPLIDLAGICWMAGFAIYVFRFAPMQLTRRPDGRAG